MRSSIYYRYIVVVSSVVCVVSVLAIAIFADKTPTPPVPNQQQIIEEVYTNTDFLPLIDVEQAKIDLADISKSFQKLADQYYERDDKRQELEDEYNDVQLTLERIMSDMKHTKSLMKDSLMKISLHKKQIARLEEQIATLKQALRTSKENLTLYTTFLYKMNNDYYGRDLAVSDVKLLVKSDNIADSLSEDHLIQMLTVKLTELLATIRTQQVSYTQSVMEANKTKLAYQKAATILSQDMQQMEEQKKHFYQLLSYLQANRVEADEKIGLLKAGQGELQEQMTYLQTATSLSNQTTIEEGTAIHQLLTISDRDEGGRYFSRPVLPIQQVNRYFDDPYYTQEYGSGFKGLSVDIPQGNELYAPAPGIVYKVFASEDLGVSWLMLIHKHGYITIYQPLSEILVEEGDIVHRGEIIARTGGQPGTTGAGIESTEPHLVFEILKNGEHIDPYTVLDISIFDKKEDLPEQYRMKYLEDYFARDVKLANLPKVHGLTIDERRDDFLRRYAVGPYTDPALRYDGAASTGIDPIFGICIGFAETSFKNFKSDNNIGNVGNDDSGNTRTYDSPLAGVQALYNVLNNQYLGQYWTINQLSRFGNSDGYIYASSPYNRQKNTMKCMSAIYGYSVPEDYPFRRLRK